MENYGIVLFDSTKRAMETEKKAQEHKLLVRIIPTPEKLNASCGFSLRYELTAETALLSIIEESNIENEGIFHVSAEGLKISYEKVGAK